VKKPPYKDMSNDSMSTRIHFNAFASTSCVSLLWSAWPLEDAPFSQPNLEAVFYSLSFSYMFKEYWPFLHSSF
jgi:hypothetical protein